MGAISFFFLSLLLLYAQDAPLVLGFTRSDFPRDFVFGAATSSYQYEGAVAEDGRSPSIWDTFTHSGKMADKSTGDIAADGYHRYKEDIKLIAQTGLEAYSFSIAWSRLIPDGRGDVNPKALEYYNSVIDELEENGIQIHATLYHLDLPQILEDEYGGWLSPRIIEDFTAYADVCFKAFGDRVSHWTTLDEVNMASLASFDNGIFAPGRCSDPFGAAECTVGDSTVEPYIGAHNMLLAHASVAILYREKYLAMQKGVVGISVYSYWSYPLTNSTLDLEAAQRCKDFLYGWILEPLVYGDYPQVMKKTAGSRLPSFTRVQSELIKGTTDFIGINHYYSLYVNNRPLETGVRDYFADLSIGSRGSRTDAPFSGKGAPADVPDDPKGMQHVLEYLKEAYGDLPIYVQENGKGSSNGSLDDADRINYLKSYMESMLNAVRNGVNVRGYFVWSLMDVFEMLAGYQTRYGLYHVEFDSASLQRRPRLSAHWYSNFLKNKESITHGMMSSLQDMVLTAQE